MRDGGTADERVSRDLRGSWCSWSPIALITTERVNKTLVALGGATAMFFLPSINSHEVFYSEDTGIDWDVIFLLLGMMIIVSVVRQTGVFEYVAIWSAKRAKGSPMRIMVMLLLVTAVGSAFLDNVTTVLLIAPVTLLVCDRLDVAAAPFLIVEAFAANIGGAATLVGDPTSIIIGTAADLSFVVLPGQHGASGDHRPGRPGGAATPHVSCRFYRRPRADRRCHVDG